MIPGVSLLITFLFAPAVSKRKVAMEAETECVYCFRANNVRPCELNFVRINIEIEKRYSRFFFCPCRPKRKSLAKRKRPGEGFAVCGRRPRLRALDGRRLAAGLWRALARRVAVLCGGLMCSRTVRSRFISAFSFTRARARARVNPPITIPPSLQSIIRRKTHGMQSDRDPQFPKY